MLHKNTCPPLGCHLCVGYFQEMFLTFSWMAYTKCSLLDKLLRGAFITILGLGWVYRGTSLELSDSLELLDKGTFLMANLFKGVLHLWALFWKTFCIFSKNKATLDKETYGSGQKCSKELKNHSFTSVEAIVVKLQC